MKKVPKKVTAKKMANGGPIKKYDDGGYLSKLNPAQLAEYKALPDDAARAQYMDNVGGKTSAPSTGLTGGKVAAIGSAATLATNAIASGTPTTRKNVETKDTVTGAVGGAAQGAALGTEIMPGWGTAIGAVAGGIYGGVTGNKKGKDELAAMGQADAAAAQAKVGAAYKKGGAVSKHGDISKEKAAEILKDGTVYGKPITDKQRKFFGSVVSQGLDMGGAVGGGGDAGGGGSGVSSGGGGISVPLGPPEHAKKPKGLLFAFGGDVQVGPGKERIKGTTQTIDMYSKNPNTGEVFKHDTHGGFSRSTPEIYNSVNKIQQLPWKNVADVDTYGAKSTDTVIMPKPVPTPITPVVGTPIPETKAKGGQIKGPGGPKDDKIPMKAAEGSFVVPAANASKAKELRKQYLVTGGSTKKVDVKVSNGEHIFTPQEVNILRSKGVDLNALAPHADEKLEKAKGGGIHINPANKGKFTATKKATGKSTEELSHSSNPLTKKRAIFALNAAKWSHKEDGGIVNALKKGGKIIPTIQPIISSSQKKVDSTPQQADAEQALASKIVVPTTNKPVTNKRFVNTQSPVGNAVKVETTTTGAIPPSADGSIAQTEKMEGDRTVQDTATQNAGLKTYKKGGKLYYKGGKVKGYDDGNVVTPEVGEDIPETKTTDNPDIFASKQSDVTEPTATGVLDAQKKIDAQDKLNTLAAKAKEDSPKSTHSNIDKLLAAGQVGLGLAQTLSYKRPQYTIPSEVQQAYGQAQQEATYGLDPAAKAQIENDIKAQTNTSTGLVAGVSGGNAANAYRMIQGLDQTAGKGLINMYVQDAAAKRAKQQQAYGLAAQLANYKNFAYQQDMNRFQQNQQAGAALLQSGISNLAGSFQYDKALQAQQQRDAMYGGKTINIPQQ